MSNQDLYPFLSEVTSRLAKLQLSGDCRNVTPRFCASKFFAEWDVPFYNRILGLISCDAVRQIDTLCGNTYWFLVMVGTALAVADSLPATVNDLSVGLTLQRKVALDQFGYALVSKVRNGEFAKLSEAEFGFAVGRGLIVVDNTNAEGDALLINTLLVG